MFYVYIIFSKNIDTYYIGQTEDFDTRLTEHNSGFFHNSFTSKANDWKLFHLIGCSSKTQAIKIEAHIKKMKSRKYIESIAKYPDIENKLKNLYND